MGMIRASQAKYRAWAALMRPVPSSSAVPRPCSNTASGTVTATCGFAPP